jgi:hypothetical protein
VAVRRPARLNFPARRLRRCRRGRHQLRFASGRLAASS